MRRALPRLPLQTRHPARCQDPKKVSSPLLPCPLKRFAPQPVRWFPLDRNSCALADRIRHVRDSDANIPEIKDRQGQIAKQMGIPVFHQWGRYELENYLIEPHILLGATKREKSDIEIDEAG